MPSLRARIVLSILRNRHLFRLSRRRDTARDWLEDIASIRRRAERSSALLGRTPKGVVAVPALGAPVPSEWIRSAHPDGGASAAKAILYFHGGGYVLGSVAAHRAITAKFAAESGVPALLFGYRLAPEHPYPAALEDAQAVYAWLLADGRGPGDVVFLGDSAGGGLLLALMLRLRDAGLPLPAAGVALSPWTDVANTGESLNANAHLCLAPRDSWKACARHYAGGADPRQPEISPLYGDLHGLPPLLLFAGGHETLLSDSTRFAQKAGQAGVDVTLRVGQGLCHCYPACAPLFPEAVQALREIGRFVRLHLGPRQV